MRIVTKLTLLGLTPFVLVGASGALFVYLAGKNAELTERASIAGNIEKKIFELTTLIRDPALSAGSQRPLVQWATVRSGLTDVLTTADFPDVASERLRTSLATTTENLDKVFLVLAEAARTEDATQTDDGIFEELVLRLTGQMTILTQAMMTSAVRLDESAHEDAEALQELTTQVIVGAAVAVTLVAGLVWILLGKSLIGPIQALRRASEEIAKGKPGNRIATSYRKDELGDLSRAFDRMADEVRWREAEIAARAEELKRSNQELSQFAYVASHDLQEPLRMVDSYLGLLKRRYQGKLDAEADEFIGYAVEGARRMKTLINDLLGYSRVSNRALNPEQVDIGRIVEAVTESFADRICTSGGEITAGALPSVKADALQMERVFINLVDNALKYRGDAPPKIAVAAERSGDFWEFSVTDNGIGIAPEFGEKIFEIFKRLHGRDKYNGTGIGLASCKRIVERHGGTIRVEAAPGGGSIFRFTLPVALTFDQGGHDA